MATIREGKVAVVDAVRERLDDSDAAVVTEYRGLTVAEMASLRRAIRAVGGDYKVFKNTLVRRAIEGSAHEPLSELLEGPTAIAFVHGDVSAVAKALRDFSRSAPSLIVKGGVLDGALLDARELTVLADLPSREVLLAMLAGAIAAPLRTMAGLLKAVPQNFAYGLSALLDAKGGAPVAAEAPAAEATATEAAEAPADEVAAGADDHGDPAGDAEASTTATESEAGAQPEAAAPDAAAEGSTEVSGDGSTEDESAGS